MAEIGSLIDGKYKVLAKIGQGGMSVVYLAMDGRLNKQWAVKEIRKVGTGVNNEVVIQSLLAEANLMKRLDHPTLPRIVDIIDTGSTIFVVMDYIEGLSLNKELAEKGPQPQEAVIEWGKQLCDALYYLHTRTPPIVYRDMKPANVMLKPDGNVKLIDFGIAREYKIDKNEDTTVLGTRGYAAPEQLNANSQTDARTDIYSLGVTLYHLVTGKIPDEPPYALVPIRELNSALSAGLEAIITRCTMANPNERYQSCAELQYALQNYEKLEQTYRKAQVKKIWPFIASFSVAILSLAVGVGSNIAATSINGASYDSKLSVAEYAPEEDKERLIFEAIDIRPTDPSGYEKLIPVFKYDNRFTKEEQTAIQKRLNVGGNTLRNATGYSELAFELGKLYWFYYDYGATDGSDNTLTRQTSALKWFNDVLERSAEDSSNRTMARIYRDIGTFSRDITLNINEASDKGKYAPYFENMGELTTIIEANPGEGEIVQLELFRLVTNSLESYSRKFLADGITQQQMDELLGRVGKGLNNVAATTDKTAELKKYIESRIAPTRKAIADSAIGYTPPTEQEAAAE